MSEEPQGSPPPRLIPDKPFPPYAYLPGRNPHPVRDPEGHSYAAEPATAEPPDPADWRACEDYLYGIDLFNHGYYWESARQWTYCFCITAFRLGARERVFVPQA